MTLITLIVGKSITTRFKVHMVVVSRDGAEQRS
jgi:hypothetical protein